MLHPVPRLAAPVQVASQPLNCLAFAYDGILYGWVEAKLALGSGQKLCCAAAGLVPLLHGMLVEA